MKITADLSKRVVIDSSVLQWVDSPIAGIRLLLKRDGLEEGALLSCAMSQAPDLPAPIMGAKRY